MYRDTCGTLRGAVDHQAAGEPLCGWCTEAEALARLRAEGIPRRPVSPVQAALNRAVLAAEVEAYERDHPSPSTRRRKLRLVRNPGASPRREAS